MARKSISKNKKTKGSKSRAKQKRAPVHRRKNPPELRAHTIGIAFYRADERLMDAARAQKGLTRSQTVRLGLRMLRASGFKLDDIAKAELESVTAGKAAHVELLKNEKVAKAKKPTKAKAKKTAKVRALQAAAAERKRKAQAQRDRKNAKLRAKRAEKRNAASTSVTARPAPTVEPETTAAA